MVDIRYLNLPGVAFQLSYRKTFFFECECQISMFILSKMTYIGLLALEFIVEVNLI